LSDEQGEIYMYDLSISKKTLVTSHARNDYKPVIYGDRIVWEDWRNGRQFPSIYMYNISTSMENRITTNTPAEFPNIYGDKIVWEGVNIYDISTYKVTQIAKGSSAFPDIYGDKIVWQDFRNGINWEIYMYNLSTQKETQITNESIGQWHPTIYGNRIVWEYWYDSYINADIYMVSISGEEPELKTPVSNVSSPISEENASLPMQGTDRSQNETGADTNTGEIEVQNEVQKTPCGFNSLIFIMVALYLYKKPIRN